ncbi:hypothetical protein LTR36_010552 [Oleoguttula mirabilis]|uniref:EKC/KEOPS complex subunit GON7 n=1 Tax=Oleoguttula mirabilis TaxID=1507867 RepID=A0AAV9JS18_9PEZI|nr:hypothetical protein LTR36_010552 [Oleoguttula mirabilis]
MSTNALTATYCSPAATQTLSSSLPPLPSDTQAENVQQKTAYLSALRSSATQMQSDINAILTQKMEEDKAAESGKGKAQEEEAKMEEMYGEEEAEDDG